MNPLTFLVLALAGGLGASVRLLLDGFIRSRVKAAYPLGTFLINVTGSLALGFVTGMALGHVIPEDLRLILGTGLMGGYTTFSTASFETVRLLQGRRYGAALANGLGMLVSAVVASVLGLWLGSML